MKHFFIRLRTFCADMFPFVVGVLVLVNVIVSFYVYRSAHPRYIYRTSEVTNVVCNVTTQIIESSSLPLVQTNLNSSLNEPVPNSYPKNYDYFVLSSVRMARMDGVTYTEGDVCSRGLILRIFPDRIFLHNGDVIENSSDARIPKTRTMKGMVRNDRRAIQ